MPATSIYWKIGSTLRLHFLELDSSGSPETGLTQGDYTIELAKDGTGNQASTGITITEVDATNNPGLYEVEISGSTGFVTATGSYALIIFKTTDGVDDGHQIGVVVTNDGTGAGSFGDAAFTATSGDGRVTDGASALSGATVRLFDPDGDLFVVTTTTATGVWGPVYLGEDGTWTVRVQKAGYQTNAASLTVSGSTATGPGSDIALTAASSGTGLTTSELTAYAQRMFYDHQGSKADTLYLEIVNDAADMLAAERDWPWYHRVGVIDFVAPYDTGTIAITSGTKIVTLTGGTWPTWAASGELVIDGQLYDVSTRDSDTQLTLTNDYNGTTLTAESYNLAQWAYDLPAQMMRLDRPLFGRDWPWGGTAVDLTALEISRDQYQQGLQAPDLWAIRENKIYVWPYPSQARNVRILYWIRPTPVVDSSDEVDWDPQLLTLLRRAIDYQVSLRGECVAGDSRQTLQTLQQALATFANRDKASRDMDIHRRNRLGTFEDYDFCGTLATT